MSRERELNEAARLLRKFRKLPASEQRSQADRLVRNIRARQNTDPVYRETRNRKTGESPISGSYNYLKKMNRHGHMETRGILFPVGIRSNGTLKWRTEDADFLADWFDHSVTNPWTRQKEGEPTLPSYIVKAVYKKARRHPYIGMNADTMLEHAIEENDAHGVREAIRRGARLNVPGGEYAPLEDAVIMNIDMVRLLLQHGADPNIISQSGSALHVAVRHKYTDIIRLLLRHGANPQLASEDMGVSAPIHSARSSEVARLLIDAGANVHDRGANGFTPIFRKPASVVAVLLEHGADPTFRSTNLRQTPLHYAPDAGSVRLLIRAGANVNARDYKGQTPLHTARSADIARELIRAGADIHARDHEGRTPLHTTTYNIIRTPLHYHRYPNQISVLLDAGAKVYARNRSGRTPLNHIEEYPNLYRSYHREVLSTLAPYGSGIGRSHPLN